MKIPEELETLRNELMERENIWKERTELKKDLEIKEKILLEVMTKQGGTREQQVGVGKGWCLWTHR